MLLMKIKKLFLIKILILTLCGAFLEASQELYPRVSTQNDTVLPKSFRSTHGLVNEIGLQQLRASGSGQFTEKGLERVIQEIPSKNIFLVDLRRELHGFVNGYDVSWKSTSSNDHEYNRELSVKQIEDQEMVFLKELLQKGSFTCVARENQNPITLTPKEVMTERQLAEKMGISYFRLPVMDNERPSDAEVDAFVSFIQSLPSDSWIHFHCAGGQGRTTSFMSMLDMIKNSQLLNADEIIKRQHAIGGSNLWQLDEAYRDHPPIRKEKAKDRLTFLRLFHQYCLENPDFSVSYSQWVSN